MNKTKNSLLALLWTITIGLFITHLIGKGPYAPALTVFVISIALTAAFRKS
ncbi:hypothetical protein FC19_GL001369 [Liquorilactobacillus aquaticus DSM 21051]|uniref:Uncharacterized protein n=1 Tax=Liquorilactobacillus aquaticus DSM 21051 TaxID=1423725 RepID=A0A0R2CXB6_9LACO|nr:hypothetical protein [Liquorilactobacillus aquaticus]KRM95890.1 hypothetical protein FC19_GL001369 [Liquorilactobacillus aquaticus DSM 21051]